MKLGDIENILLKEVVPSSGCTEISSLAYLVALAKENSKEINKIKILMDSNVYKNAKSVGIPGGGRGIELVVRRALLSKPMGLDTLKTSKRTYKNDLKLEINILNTDTLIIAVQIDDNVYAFLGDYSNLKTYKDLNSLFNDLKNQSPKYYYGLTELSIDELLKYAIELYKDDDIKKLINRAKELNLNLSNCKPQSLCDDDDECVLKTMSAIDARMSGARCPAMSVAGSGNQGIFTTVPLIIIAKNRGISEKRLDISILFAWLMTIYSTELFGKVVSQYYGLLHKAGVGLIAGLSYLLNKNNIEARIMELFNLAGVFCDGAKPNCGKKAKYLLKIINR